MPYLESRYDYFNDYGCGYFEVFLKRNPEFNTEEFTQYVGAHNKGDREDLHSIAKHEVLRLAAEFEEHKWRSGFGWVAKGF